MCAMTTDNPTVELSHLFTETKILANHRLKLRLMYQRCKPPIHILERLAELWLEHLQCMHQQY